LIQAFIDEFNSRDNRTIKGVSPAAMRQLEHYDWPENVRELENLIERGVVLSSGPTLDLNAHLWSLPSSPAQPASIAKPAPAPIPSVAPALDEGSSALEDVERQHILAVLERAAWIIEGGRGAAQLLNLTPSTLRSRMKKLGIVRGAHDIS